MWTCANCGEVSEESFDACWKCGTTRDGTPPVHPEVYQPDTENAEPTGPAYETPCPICGAASYSWGDVQGHYPLIYKDQTDSMLKKIFSYSGHSIKTRLCQTCGNLQLFLGEMLPEAEPQV